MTMTLRSILHPTSLQCDANDPTWLEEPANQYTMTNDVAKMLYAEREVSRGALRTPPQEVATSSHGDVTGAAAEISVELPQWLVAPVEDGSAASVKFHLDCLPLPFPPLPLLTLADTFGTAEQTVGEAEPCLLSMQWSHTCTYVQLEEVHLPSWKALQIGFPVRVVVYLPLEMLCCDPPSPGNF
jgi:hypothetical protein